MVRAELRPRQPENPTMTKSEAKILNIIHARRNEIARDIVEHPSDQPDVRWTVEKEDNRVFVTFEASIVNPDTGYSSPWSWQDRIAITKLGRKIG